MLGRDPHTRVLAAYLEGVTDGQRFMQVGKAGRPPQADHCPQGRRDRRRIPGGRSHTGALAGTEQAYEAAFRQAGILRAGTVEDLLDWSHVLQLPAAPRGRRHRRADQRRRTGRDRGGRAAAGRPSTGRTGTRDAGRARRPLPARVRAAQPGRPAGGGRRARLRRCPGHAAARPGRVRRGGPSRAAHPGERPRDPQRHGTRQPPAAASRWWSASLATLPALPSWKPCTRLACRISPAPSAPAAPWGSCAGAAAGWTGRPPTPAALEDVDAGAARDDRGAGTLGRPPRPAGDRGQGDPGGLRLPLPRFGAGDDRRPGRGSGAVGGLSRRAQDRLAGRAAQDRRRRRGPGPAKRQRRSPRLWGR